ncbi:MAG: hypothetical protein LC131_09055 [Anaerolineae bacterium]|nr:hypothetical protein [Anaerolineae bacterium]HNS38955.1 hypothetical protein [Promineifilum sp.]
MTLLSSPPIAFMIYIGLVALLYLFGRLMAPIAKPHNSIKSSLYAGGEVASTKKAAPGYRRFFIVALFFAVLHLAALVLATAGLTAGGIVIGANLWVAVLIYLIGLTITLVIIFLS